MKIADRIKALREQMKIRGIDVYLVPTADFHQSEYVGDYFKVREFITGFTGSAGTALITQDEARLWTDGRYFIQAETELAGTTVKLMKMREPGVPTLEDYLSEVIPTEGVLGFDGRVVAMTEGQRYEEIAAAKEAKILYNYDLIDDVWEDRPALSKEPVFALGTEYTGENVASKLERIRKAMQENSATMHVLTTLDDICWTLNLRGNDIEYMPLILAYAMITMDKMYLYIDKAKLSEEIKSDLAKDGIVLRPYNDIYDDIKNIDKGEILLIDPDKLNYALYHNIPKKITKVEKENPEILFKARKNEVEVENIRKAQIKDSVAHVRFMKWIKETVGRETITEISAIDKLDSFREEMGNFIRPSFDAISAFGEHAAIVHYSSSPETNVELKKGSLYLTDTGAGFMEGSTDITRTYALGDVPKIMKEHFTLVAMSNLSLASARFLKGSTGANLDILAKKPFWDRELDFNHGTGHGVGYLLNIHEEPVGISWRYRQMDCHILEKGMIITNEPGMYIEGSHGIRLENELLVCEGKLNKYGQFMYFEPITYIPFDLDAIVPDMMTSVEKRWLNDYHKLVFEKISPYLDEEEKAWLMKYTRAV